MSAGPDAMPDAMPDAHCRVERSTSLSVDLRDGQTRARETCFEGFQRVRGRARHLCSGPCPEHPLPELAAFAPAFPGQVQEALGDLARACGGAAALRYTATAGVRLVAGMSLSAAPVTRATWSLTGAVRTPGGRRVPIGMSGRLGADPGLTGLAPLRDPAVRARLAWTCARVDRAALVRAGAVVPAVLSPASAALLVHEAVGHFAEADQAVGLSHRLGTRLGSACIQVQDHPTAPGGAACYAIDDDGVEVWGPTELVRDGVLVAQLHTLATARRDGAAPTANGRARSAWDPSVARISNLVCAGGTSTVDEMLDRMGDGLHIHQLADGFGLGARIEARVVLAEWVRAGRPSGRFVTGGRIATSVAVLTRVVELGADAAFRANSMCGKAGQLLLDVGTCAPSMRLSALELVP